MSDDNSFSFYDVNISEQPDPLVKLPALAERLGVKPVDRLQSYPPSFYLVTKSGESYDLFDLVNAALDRLEGKKDGTD